MQVLKDDIRQKIIDVARTEFYRKGFAKTSMRSVAIQVGVGNLYNYFNGKDELFCAVVRPVTEEFWEMMDRHHGDDGRDAIGCSPRDISKSVLMNMCV